MEYDIYHILLLVRCFGSINVGKKTKKPNESQQLENDYQPVIICDNEIPS